VLQVGELAEATVISDGVRCGGVLALGGRERVQVVGEGVHRSATAHSKLPRCGYGLGGMTSEFEWLPNGRL
jgi:hypothetical protein